MGKKVLTTEQIRRIEKRTMQARDMKSWVLMERAATALKDWIAARFRLDQVVFLIVAGPGNNGGDGLALAILLYDLDADVAISLWSEKSSFSSDNKRNQELARELGIPFLDSDELYSWLSKQKNAVIGIDALFGIGFNGEMRAYYRPAVEILNDRRHISEVLSVDMPGGMPTEEELSSNEEWVVKATDTLSFEFPKPSFLYRNHEEYLGNWHVLDIGFDVEAIQDEKALASTIDIEDMRSILLHRKRFDYKNSIGHVCICGGSRGKYGAIVIASRACLRGGAGLLTVAAPQSAFSIIQSTVPEAMFLENSGDDYLQTAPDFTTFHSLGLGPGMGQKEESKEFIRSALQSNKPIVIDADALNALAQDRELLDLLHEDCLLTPHDGEFRRLVGEWSNEKERMDKLKQFVQKHNCTVLLKGPYSMIASSLADSLSINTSGNPGMAVGGMGDALTGILAALLSRGYNVYQAACLGAFVHGRAGDYAAKEYGFESLLPSDLIAYLPDVWMELYE